MEVGAGVGVPGAAPPVTGRTAGRGAAAGATTGARNVTVTYNGGQTRTITNGFTVN